MMHQDNASVRGDFRSHNVKAASASGFDRSHEVGLLECCGRARHSDLERLVVGDVTGSTKSGYG